jgi:hypothetical protein
MRRRFGLRRRSALALLALASGILFAPALARADLLINNLNEANAVDTNARVPGHVAPASVLSPSGPATVRSSMTGTLNLMALVAVCVHPPIDPPPPTVPPTTPPPVTPPPTTGTGIIQSEGGAPEPGSLVIALIGAGAAGVASFMRRRTPAQLA